MKTKNVTTRQLIEDAVLHRTSEGIEPDRLVALLSEVLESALAYILEEADIATHPQSDTVVA